MLRNLIFFLSLIVFSLAELNLEDVTIPDFDDLNVVKERCDKKGGAGTYENIKKSKDQVQSCLQNLINFENITKEIDVAKKTGSMDEVFGKYCKKRPEIKACIDIGIDAMKPCLEDTEKESLNKTLDVLKKLGDFVCFQDGDRIAMFIAEGGVQCINQQSEGIKNCINATLKINTDNLSINSIPNLAMNKKKCDDITTVQQCVEKELEKCKDTTPANMVDALFKLIKKYACKDIKKRRSIFKRETKYHAWKQDSNKYKDKMFSKLKNSCLKYGKPSSWLELERAILRYEQCIGQHQHEDINNMFNRCNSELIKKFQDCLPEHAKYYPEFFVTMRKSVQHFVKTNREKTLSKADNAVFFNCMNTLRASNSKVKFEQCLDKLFEIDFAPKPDTCRSFEDFTKCVSHEIKTRCIRDVRTDLLLNEFSEAILKPCDNTSN